MKIDAYSHQRHCSPLNVLLIGVYYVNFGESHVISQIWEATTAKQMKIDPCCQQQ